MYYLNMIFNIYLTYMNMYCTPTIRGYTLVLIYIFTQHLHLNYLQIDLYMYIIRIRHLNIVLIPNLTNEVYYVRNYTF